MNLTIETKQKTREVILELIPDLTANELADNSDIFDLGLDSINAMTLVFNLQETFNIKFDSSEIDVENFRSVTDITKLVNTKI